MDQRTWTERLFDTDPTGDPQESTREVPAADAADYFDTLARTIRGTHDRHELWWASVLGIDLSIRRNHDSTRLTYGQPDADPDAAYLVMLEFDGDDYSSYGDGVPRTYEDAIKLRDEVIAAIRACVESQCNDMDMSIEDVDGDFLRDVELDTPIGIIQASEFREVRVVKIVDRAGLEDVLVG